MEQRPPNAVGSRSELGELLAKRRGNFGECAGHDVERGLLERRTHAQRRVRLRVETRLVDHHEGRCGGAGSEQPRLRFECVLCACVRACCGRVHVCVAPSAPRATCLQRSLASRPHAARSSRPFGLCSDVNAKRPSGSLSSTKLTQRLQKLHTVHTAKQKRVSAQEGCMQPFLRFLYLHRT